MCEICFETFGHKAGCPEADEAAHENYGACEICGYNIEEGQDYFDYQGKKYHRDCFTDAYLKFG